MRMGLDVFNNREIAISIWAIIIMLILIFFKPIQETLRTILPILFCRKFVVFYIVFISFLFVVLHFLKWTTFWDNSLLKDTVFWVIFVELPLFTKTIESAKDGYFFSALIKDNLKLIVLIEFYIGFWTFSLPIELALVPITVTISSMYALASQEKEHKPVKQFFNGLLTIWSLVLIINAIYNTVNFPEQYFSLATLKSFILPIILLILNLPVVYGLALYNGYEQLFIKIKRGAKQKGKMKLQIILFAGLSLSKVTAIRRNLRNTIHVSLNADDMKHNLALLKKHLSMQIGDNYMKRSNYYVKVCVVTALASLIGLIWANSNVTIRELITFDFVIIMPRFKEITTYICCVSLVFSITILFYSFGLQKEKYEDISQIKKYALFEFLYSLKKQKEQLQEYLPLDDALSLYTNYLLIVTDLKEACTKALDVYGNLLNAWERESIELLQSSAHALLIDFTIGGKDISKHTASSFCKLYDEKVKSSQVEKLQFIYVLN